MTMLEEARRKDKIDHAIRITKTVAKYALCSVSFGLLVSANVLLYKNLK